MNNYFKEIKEAKEMLRKKSKDYKKNLCDFSIEFSGDKSPVKKKVFLPSIFDTAAQILVSPGRK